MKAIIYSDGHYHLTYSDEIPINPYNTFDIDAEVREWEYCQNCGTPIIPHYREPFAGCECTDMEWYK